MDLVAGPGRTEILAQSGLSLADLQARFKARGYGLVTDLAPLAQTDTRRSVMLLDDARFDLAGAVQKMIGLLGKNPKGFFLVVHSDCHLKDVRKSLECVVALDKIVQSVSEAHSQDTLVLVTADHAYGLRVEGQKVEKSPDFLSQISLLDDHTGEDVPVLAIGPGSERSGGVASNTDVFDWVRKGFGWSEK
jgi:alkaline phosphatase